MESRATRVVVLRVGDRVTGPSMRWQYVEGVMVEPLSTETPPGKGPAVRVLSTSGRRVWLRRQYTSKVED